MSRTERTGASLCSTEQLSKLLTRLAGKRVVLLGLGLFGGGEGAARFLAQRGARVIVSDLKTADQLAPALKRLEGAGDCLGVRGRPVEVHRSEVEL